MQQTESVFIVSILVLIGLIIAVIVAIREKVVQLQLSSSGVQVDGHITRKEGSWINRKYYLTYDYDYHGSTYSRRERVSSYHYNDVKNADEVSVSFLPEHPKIARLEYKIPVSMVGQVALILIGIVEVIIVLALLLVLVWFVWIVYNIYSGPPT